MKLHNSRISRSTRMSQLVAILFVSIAAGCNPPPPSAHDAKVSTEGNGAKISGADQAKPPHLITITISPESRVKAASEDIATELQQGVWKEFLIEIENAAGITAPLKIESEQLMQDSDDTSRDRWLQIELAPDGALTGKRDELRILKIKSRDSGIRTAIFNFNAGQGTQDLGFRSDVLITFKVVVQ
jgi:hypothetical protein